MIISRFLTPGAELAPALRARISGDAIVAFLEAASDWKLSWDEELWLADHPEPCAFQRARESAVNGEPLCLDSPLLQRIAFIVDIHRMMADMLPDRHLQARWLRAPNLMTGLRPPLNVIGDADLDGLSAYHAALLDWHAAWPIKGAQIREVALNPA